jgi:hypothetical protein
MEVLECSREESYRMKVIIFQSRIRSGAAMLKYDLALKKKHATVMQKHVRADNAKKLLQKLKLEDFKRKKAAAIRIQEYGRFLLIYLFIVFCFSPVFSSPLSSAILCCLFLFSPSVSIPDDLVLSCGPMR